MTTISELRKFFEKNGYELIDAQPFDEKSDAYDCIDKYYRRMPGITTYPYKGQYYIVQASFLM